MYMYVNIGVLLYFLFRLVNIRIYTFVYAETLNETNLLVAANLFHTFFFFLRAISVLHHLLIIQQNVVNLYV